MNKKVTNTGNRNTCGPEEGKGTNAGGSVWLSGK